MYRDKNFPSNPWLTHTGTKRNEHIKSKKETHKNLRRYEFSIKPLTNTAKTHKIKERNGWNVQK